MNTRLCARIAVALSIFPAVRLPAQDVTVGDVRWHSTDPAPDELPKAKSLRPDFPDEMRTASEIGYVIISRALDATGKGQSLSAVGTQIAFQRAVEKEFQNWSMSPAKRDGHGVDARIWLPVIFNPKSATVKGRDATPRLLAVAPVMTKDRPPVEANQPTIVRMHLSLDPTGAIVTAQPEEGTTLKPRLLEDIREGLSHWRFAPARAAGQPVAAEITLPVICQAVLSTPKAKFVPPRPTHQEPPEYPLAMRRYGLTGQVLIDFEIDLDGKVVNPVIAESDNPAFDEPAIKALLKWTFQPATRDGKPTKVKQRVPIIFALNWGPGESGIFSMRGGGDPSKLPVEYRYDSPPKFRSVLLPVYPAELRQKGTRGKATVAMVISPQGRVTQTSIVSADQPEFGLALTAAVESFRFDPALKDGKPVPTILKLEHEFDNRAADNDAAERLVSLEKKHPERIVSADKLDAAPQPISRRPPVFPLNVAPETTKGEALIEFLIDEDGHARLPTIVSASETAFGYAAVQAVGTWLFAPPLANGKAVVVRARIPLAFSLKSAPKPKPAEASR